MSRAWAHGPEYARAFFALWPDADSARAMRGWPLGGARPVHVLDLHLTVVFLGRIDTTALPALAEDLPCAPFGLTFGHCEYWPGPRVCVACPDAVPSELVELHALLGDRLRTRGAFAAGADVVPFRPHVTLARAGGATIMGRVAPVHWHVGAITLAVSEPLPGGPRYRRLATLPFAPLPA